MDEGARQEALSKLKTYIDGKNEELGLDSQYVCMAPGFTYGSKVNAPDTWTGPLADAEAECTEQDVDELAAAFIDLSEAVGEQQT